MNNILLNSVINFKSNNDYKLIVEDIGSKDILKSKLTGKVQNFELKNDIQDYLNNREFISIQYKDNYGDDDSFSGTILITLAQIK